MYKSRQSVKDEDVLLDKVVKKTNVNKGEILKLANDLQSKDLNNENDIILFSSITKTGKNEVYDEIEKYL